MGEAEMSPRACIIGNKDCSGYAVPGTSRCEAHTRSNWARYKPAHAQFYRKVQWTDLRKRVLREQPICDEDGCTARATSVDHIVSLADGGAPFERSNVRGLCYPHHKTRSSRQGAEAKNRGAENDPATSGMQSSS